MTTEDENAANEIDRNHWLRGAPEHAADFQYDQQAAAGVCPACSTPVPANTAECPECGLLVNPEAEKAICPECELGLRAIHRAEQAAALRPT